VQDLADGLANPNFKTERAEHGNTHTNARAYEKTVVAPVAPVAPEGGGNGQSGNAYLCISAASEKAGVVRQEKQAPHEKI
jgi:hypothetical protein